MFEVYSEDESIGYIMRRLSERGIEMRYSDVKAVLDMETEFLATKGIGEGLI